MSFRYTNDKKTDFKELKDKYSANPIKKDKKFYCSLGDSFMLKNEYRKAVKEYLVSLMIDKNNIYARKGASKAYKNLKEYDKAIKHLKDARNIYGFDSEVYYELGLNYLLSADNLNCSPTTKMRKLNSLLPMNFQEKAIWQYRFIKESSKNIRITSRHLQV